MSMMWPPQSVKIVSTPSFLSALATRWPPEITLASRLLRCRVSSAVLGLAGIGVGFTVAMLSPNSRMDPAKPSGGARARRSRDCGCRRGHRSGEFSPALCKMLHAHGLQYKKREQSRCDIETHCQDKYRPPAVRFGNAGCDGHEQCAGALGRVQHAGIGRGKLGTEGIALG